jgi:glycosyltransferase involved in cell wall biosynthesis
MRQLATIALPIYRRLEYLPQVLGIVEAQDYPDLELIVSDNGQNGSKVRDLVEAHYHRPCRFRQNPSTVNVTEHFNQILHEASGAFYVVLSDDDEISPNFVSELVGRLEACPRAALAYGRQEFIDKEGRVLRQSVAALPDVITGQQFMRAAWQSFELKFEMLGTYLGRTELMKRCGGWPDFAKGNHIDNALVLKLCLNGDVAFSSNCAFRWRIDESSLGWSVPIRDMSASTREFLRFLRTDPVVRQFAKADPAQWREINRFVVEMAWATYLGRWRDMYRRRLPRWQWVQAAFALPYIPAYYREVRRILFQEFRSALGGRSKGR